MGSRNPGMKRAIIAVVLLAVVGGGVGAWYSQQNKTEIQVSMRRLAAATSSTPSARRARYKR